jgi:serpin B
MGGVLMKTLILIPVIVFGFIIWHCNATPTDKDLTDRANINQDLNSAEKNLVQSDNIFGLKIFKKLTQSESNKNVFISPFSISMALGMLYNGADGQTRDAMQETLELQWLNIQEVNESYQSQIALLTNADSTTQLEIANSIWIDDNLIVKPQFYRVNKDYFDAEVRKIDFGAPNSASIINSWVNDKTHGKIPGIVKPPLGDLLVTLINAVYFKGEWISEFNHDATKPADFYLADGSTTKIDMMTQEKRFRYLENDLFQAIELPYGNGRFSMVVFLPKLKEISNDADNLIARFSNENWNNWLGSFESALVRLYLPKFELSYSVVLNRILSKLGMGIAFTPYADFSNISNDSLWIDMVIHKGYIHVYEEGTEAIAVTGITMLSSPGPQQAYIMRVDRPFVLAILEERSGAILFIGEIINPAQMDN